MYRLGLSLLLLAGSLNCGPVVAQTSGKPVGQREDPSEDSVLIPRSALLLSMGPGFRGRAITYGPLEAMMVRGELTGYRPREGEGPGTGGEDAPVWTSVEFDQKGEIRDRRLMGAYLYTSIESDTERPMILEAGGQSTAWLNGQPRSGNVYNYSYADLPVLLRQGTNHLYQRVSRGRARVRFYEPPAPVFLNQGDLTMPDLIVGQETAAVGAVIVMNATGEPVAGLSLRSHGEHLLKTVVPVPTIPPMSIRKVACRLAGPAPSETGDSTATLMLLAAGQAEAVHRIEFKLRCRKATDNHKRTFVSRLDGSVQYFGLRPAFPTKDEDPAPAIVLSCHGASVQAIGQSAAYGPKRWVHLVAPTNRRPYGFDWEDFGRADAIEVLDLACRDLYHDPDRIYLTGHSMGGHGAWHLGVTHPDRFAAVGPSAGWISYTSYARSAGHAAPETAVGQLLRRTANASDTEGLVSNLKSLGVYILHGDKDDNVPVSQARRMAEVLGEFHQDWVFHAEPDKGHWWSSPLADGGAACVDWPGMFDLFARHTLAPAHAVREVQFVTANPGVSHRYHWAAIEGQIRHLDFSRVHLHTWPNKRAFRGTTENVAVLRLDLGHLQSEGPIQIDLDGQKMEDLPFPKQAQAVWLRREKNHWSLASQPPAAHKGPHRYGAIKNELKHDFLLVYGTLGHPSENQWAYDKARLDAETFWYRGNASVDMVQDTRFKPEAYADRTVVLYGNADTNAAWPILLADSPVVVRRGKVAVGQRSIEGDDLGAVFLRPRQDSRVASVVAVSGSGLVGMRLVTPQSFFLPFIRYPDCVVYRAANLESGRPEIPVAGFFGLDWSVEKGEFVWSER